MLSARQCRVQDLSGMSLDWSYIKIFISWINEFWMGLKYLSGLNDIPVEAMNTCWQQWPCQRYWIYFYKYRRLFLLSKLTFRLQSSAGAFFVSMTVLIFWVNFNTLNLLQSCFKWFSNLYFPWYKVFIMYR